MNGENNFAYRISYSSNDELHSVCEAFNHMAAQGEQVTNFPHRKEAKNLLFYGKEIIF